MYPNWINASLFNKTILNEKFLKVGFSQAGEDEVIRDFFWKDILLNKKRTYLDIGCFHDTLYSNTKLLNLAGWRGIAIDANPDAQERWTQNRTQDTFLNLGIKSSGGFQQQKTLNFFRFNSGEINTFEKKAAKAWIDKGFELRDIIDVECKDLQEIAKIILSIHPNFSPAFLNIDIEQVDYLDDLPRFLALMSNPDLVCIEWIYKGFDINNFKESKEFQILNSCNYKTMESCL